MKKELPIQVNNDISYMLMYSLPLQAILANENTIPWYMENYLEYWGNLSREGLILVFSDAVSYLPPDLYHNDYFRLDSIDLRLATLKKDILSHLKLAINRGEYTLLFLDENALPNTLHEGLFFPHEYLVYGYDDELQQIKCIGLNKFGHSDAIHFDYEDIKNAFTSYLMKDLEPKIISFNLGEFFFKRKRHRYCLLPAFDKRFFLYKLQAYINEVPTYQVITDDDIQFYWGIGLLDGFMSYLQDNRITKLDFRHPFFFMDQAHLIYQRLLYFLDVEKIVLDRNLEQIYKELSDNLIKLKNRYLKLCGMDCKTDLYVALKMELLPIIAGIKRIEKMMIQTVLDTQSTSVK